MTARLILAAARRLGFAPATKVDSWRRAYDVLWSDHLARCNCHDSWDQCPCSEVGHKEPLAEGRSIYPCPNKCCRWCG